MTHHPAFAAARHSAICQQGQRRSPLSRSTSPRPSLLLQSVRRAPAQQKPAGKGVARRSLVARASLQAQEKTEEGKALYAAGNRMGAIKAFEEALEEGPTAAQRQGALYNMTCCHASFGDVELAQITLREALNAGLDFEVALANPDYVPFTSSKQAKIQLRKFAEAYSKSMAKAAATKQPEMPSPMGGQVAEKKSVQELLGTKDVSDMTSTELKGIDASVGGIVSRVAGLLLVLTGVGVAAYLLGLEYVMSVPENSDFGADIMDSL